MTADELRVLLHKRGLTRVADQLLQLAAPTVRVYIRPADEDAIPIGASKVGGRPDLPAGVDWPSWHEPMAFIAQFNLAEVAPHDREGALQTHGLLSFFYETDGEPLYAERWGLTDDTPYEDAYHHGPRNMSWRVLYHEDDPMTFVRREISPQLNERACYLPCATRFAAEVTIPDVDGPEMRPLGLSEAERGAIIDIDNDVNHGTWEDGGHHLLGYPYNLDGSALVQCDLEARGLSEDWHAADEERQLQMARDAVGRWRLLLQVGSSEDADMDWAGAGVLQFYIEREALRARDFSRVWVDLQFL